MPSTSPSRRRLDSDTANAPISRVEQGDREDPAAMRAEWAACRARARGVVKAPKPRAGERGRGEPITPRPRRRLSECRSQVGLLVPDERGVIRLSTTYDCCKNTARRHGGGRRCRCHSITVAIPPCRPAGRVRRKPRASRRGLVADHWNSGISISDPAPETRQRSARHLLTPVKPADTMTIAARMTASTLGTPR